MHQFDNFGPYNYISVKQGNNNNIIIILQDKNNNNDDNNFFSYEYKRNDNVINLSSETV